MLNPSRTLKAAVLVSSIALASGYVLHRGNHQPKPTPASPPIASAANVPPIPREAISTDSKSLKVTQQEWDNFDLPPPDPIEPGFTSWPVLYPDKYSKRKKRVFMSGTKSDRIEIDPSE